MTCEEAQSGVSAIAAGNLHTVALLGRGGSVPLITRLDGNQLVVSWPTNAAGLTLQSTPDLAPPATWTDVTTAPSLLGREWMVTNSLGGGAQFYRLRKP